MKSSETKNTHRNCLLCGNQNPQSLGLTFDKQPDGSVSARCQASEDHQGYDGILHGGIIASLLDSAMTHCLFMQGVEAVTAELKVRYLHPVPCGSQITIHAHLEETFEPLYRLRANLIIGDKIVARGEARFISKKNCKL
jgi:uncharacterized protein (TIGR00369 family)